MEEQLLAALAHTLKQIHELCWFIQSSTRKALPYELTELMARSPAERLRNPSPLIEGLEYM